MKRILIESNIAREVIRNSYEHNINSDSTPHKWLGSILVILQNLGEQM